MLCVGTGTAPEYSGSTQGSGVQVRGNQEEKHEDCGQPDADPRERGPAAERERG